MGKEEDNNNRDNESKFNAKSGALNDVTCTSIKNNNHSWQKMLQEEEELIDRKQKKEKKLYLYINVYTFIGQASEGEIIIIFSCLNSTVTKPNKTLMVPSHFDYENYSILEIIGSISRLTGLVS